MPRTSVIISTYNRAHLFEKALQSVLSQEFREFEVIVVDDGSTDATRAIVNRVTDSRLQYVYQTNSGRSAARNRGIGLTTGDYISFLDDDDVWLPDKLEYQSAFLDRNSEIDIVGANAVVVDVDDATLGRWPSEPTSLELTPLSALYECPLMPSSVLLRRSALARLDHWFDPAVEPAEDKDLFVRMLAAGSRAVLDSEALLNYRVHTGNSQGDGDRYSRSRLRSLDKLFASSRVPSELADNRKAIYAYYHLTGAVHAYATGHFESAKRDLVRAYEMDTALFLGRQPKLVECIVARACSPLHAAPTRYIDAVFDNLPLELQHLRELRRTARAAYHMRQFFSVAGLPNAGWRCITSYVCALSFEPRWILNRGTWSILVRQVVRGVVARLPRSWVGPDLVGQSKISRGGAGVPR